ncbi:MAG: hypothetical protein QM790_08790 [Nibricoccus sp.]
MSTALPRKAPPCLFPPVAAERIEREKSALLQLTREMKSVQKRLGTSRERSGDYQLARDLGHAIRNKIHLLRLWNAVGMLKLTRSQKPCVTMALTNL